jgi:hypothetical protein
VGRVFFVGVVYVIGSPKKKDKANEIEDDE